MRRLLTTLAMLLLASFSSFAQESIIKDFAESRRDRKFCLYPSTLRMINVSGDKEFYELVNNIDKVLIYQLDSSTIASNTYSGMIDQYIVNGFEEYISLTGGGQTLQLFGKEEEFVGIGGAGSKLMTFYLKGSIGFHKIPKLLETFEEGNILNVLADQFE